MQVAFHCGCGTVIQVDPTAVGRWIRCPVCRRKISRSELQGPRARILTGMDSGASASPGGFVRHSRPFSPQPSLPWGWIGAACSVLLLLLLGMLGWSVWEHFAPRLAENSTKPEAATKLENNEKSPVTTTGAPSSGSDQATPSSPPGVDSEPSSRDQSQPLPSAGTSSRKTVPSPVPASLRTESPKAASSDQPNRPEAPPSAPPASNISSPEISWRRIVDRQGAFEVLFPQGRISREQTAGVYGPLFMQLALTRWGEFRVIYADFPPNAPLQGMEDVQRLFGPMLQELYGPLQGYPRPIQLHGFPGAKLRFAKGRKLTLAHVFLVRRRVYLVLWTGETPPPWLDRFFASFDLPWARR